MILELIFEFILLFLELIFGWVHFPQVPQLIEDIIDTFFSYLSNGMAFVNLIVFKSVFISCLPVILVVENFDKLYSVVMWILKKIPFLGMK